MLVINNIILLCRWRILLGGRYSSDIKQVGNEKLSFQQLLLDNKPILKKTSDKDNLKLPPLKILRK